MTTTKERFQCMLEERGMFPNQAQQVMTEAMSAVDHLVPGYCVSWDRPASEYPDAVYSVLWSIVQAEAVRWIDANCPKAWFRPAFAYDAEKLAALLAAE